MKILKQEFYNQPTIKVAQDLLGCFLVRKINDKIIRTKIVETEAYNGPRDLASHASKRRTSRNEVMFGEPGVIYVYFTYGLHYMLNVVTEKEGYPAAVLIRAVEPINDKLNTSGPARLTKALEINKSFNELPVYIKRHGLWIEGKEGEIKNKDIIKTKRVGVDYAKEYKNKKWRFYIKDNKFISKV